MLYIVNLPDIGEGVVEGEVIEWLKQVGESLEQDEPVVIVMTDKATVELPAPVPGILAKQYVKTAGIAIKDQPLYAIETKEVVKKEEIKPKIPSEIPQEPIKGLNSRSNRALALPKVRKMASEMGIDIERVIGSGKDGRVTIEDLKNFIQSAKPLEEHLMHLPDDEEMPLVGIRNLMAKKMTESKNQIPHFSLCEQVDATRLVKLKTKYQEEALKRGIHVTYMPFIIRALSLSLQTFPEVNSSLDVGENKLIIHHAHHIGIAMSSSHGLIVPVLRSVEKMHLNEIIEAFEDLKKRAAAHQLSPEELKGSTITVTNFGVFGGNVAFATPIINYPEVAILGVARIQQEPVVKENSLVVQDTLHLSWSFDHRVIDGEMAASFFKTYGRSHKKPSLSTLMRITSKNLGKGELHLHC